MTKSAEIQTEIAELEAQLEPINLGLDSLYQEFIAVLPANVEKWMKTTVKRTVEERADKINDAGLEPLRLLKLDLAELIDRLPELCVQAVGPSNEWPHRRLKATLGRSTNDYISESHAAVSFRKAIAGLGGLLAKHGLIYSLPGRGGDWVSCGQGEYRYAYNPGFEERDFVCLARYQEQWATQKRHLDLLEVKRLELAKAKASELWDKA